MQFVPFPSTVHVVEPIRIRENGSHIDGMKIRLAKINTNERVVRNSGHPSFSLVALRSSGCFLLRAMLS
ncbi:hypothetical protein OUZ56_022729 [Daphnia magna]|uniref:Uncharacterized protein n=1 Tax=Daphnia magna TaxID=35525 RepID=A0ABR0AXC2_9CRUS|nr:hypothetical protein OUZ56_022729 [Daphnia magna]